MSKVTGNVKVTVHPQGLEAVRQNAHIVPNNNNNSKEEKEIMEQRYDYSSTSAEDAARRPPPTAEEGMGMMGWMIGSAAAAGLCIAAKMLWGKMKETEKPPSQQIYERFMAQNQQDDRVPDYAKPDYNNEQMEQTLQK
jgi:hypothetical protein